MPRGKKGLDEVVIEYRVPVYVVVRDDHDGSGPAIRRVVVNDEVDLIAGKIFVEDAEQGPVFVPLSSYDQFMKAARRLVEEDNGAEWPAWEFGW